MSSPAIPLIDGTTGVRLPIKPALGSPYNGCGYCCATAPCAIATTSIPGCGEEGPCPALERHDGKFVCGMIRRASHYMALPNDWADARLGALFAEALGSGKGCEAEDPENGVVL